MKRDELYVGVDLGGTNVRAAVIDPAGHVLGQEKHRLLSREPPQVAEAVVRAAKTACGAAGLPFAEMKGMGIGIAAMIEGNRISDIGAAVEGHVAPFGYGIVRDYVGHGIGKKLHEDPQVPNYGPALWTRGQPNPRLRPGMVLAIEPMINLGTHEVEVLPDGWTVVTRDGKISSHWEHTIAVTETGPKVLTRP